MDTDKIEKNSLEDVKIIVIKLGGWPVLEESKWTGEGFKWYHLCAKARQEGLSQDQMISLNIVTDLEDTFKRILVL